MKTKHNDYDLLIIEDRPWPLVMSLAGSAMFVLGVCIAQLFGRDLGRFDFFAGGVFLLMFVYLSMRRVRVVFHRPEG